MGKSTGQAIVTGAAGLVGGLAAGPIGAGLGAGLVQGTINGGNLKRGLAAGATTAAASYLAGLGSGALGGAGGGAAGSTTGSAAGSYTGSLGPEFTSSLLSNSGQAAAPYYSGYTGMLGSEVGTELGASSGAAAGGAFSGGDYPGTFGTEYSYTSPSASETYNPDKTKIEDTDLGSPRGEAVSYPQYEGMLGQQPYGSSSTPYGEMNVPSGESIGGSTVNPTPVQFNSAVQTEPSLWDVSKKWGEEAWDYGKNKYNQMTGAQQEKGSMLNRVFNKDNLLPAALMAGGNYLSAAEQKKLSEELYNQQQRDIATAQETALANWQKYAFPSQSAITAATSAGKSGLAQNTLTAKRGLDEALAARGIAGGGIAAGEYGKLERNRQLNYANLVNQLTQYANTPTSAAPISTAYAQQQMYTPWQTSLANVLNSIGGNYSSMMFYDWLRNQNNQAGR